VLDYLADPIFARCPTAQAVASSALQMALGVMGARKGNVQFVQWERDPALHIVAQSGFEEEFLGCFRQVLMSDSSACGRALLLRNPVIIRDVAEDHDFTRFAAIAQRAGFRSVTSIPLISTGNALFGMLSTHGPEPGQPSPEQLRTLERIAHAAAQAILGLRAQGRGAIQFVPLARTDARTA
jgi:GAF domain-containing protein